MRLFVVMMAACGTEYAPDLAPLTCPDPSAGMKVVQRAELVDDHYEFPHPACPGDLLVRCSGDDDPVLQRLGGGEQVIEDEFTCAWELANVVGTPSVDQRTGMNNATASDAFDGGILPITAAREFAIATLVDERNEPIAILPPFGDAYHDQSFSAAIALLPDEDTQVTAIWKRTTTAQAKYQTRLWIFRSD